MADNGATTVGGIGATETTFDIIEELQASDGVGVSELAGEIGVSKSTVHNHLQTLQRRGYVIRKDGVYRLGLRFLQLGDTARQRHGLYHVAKQELDSLVEEVGERGQIMVEEAGAGIYIYQSLADRAVRTDSHIGTIVNLHATAVGKAYLAHLPADKRTTILDNAELSNLTPNTIIDRERLEGQLDDIRDRGYAFNDEERLVGMRAVGAPILTDDDDVLAAISVSGPATRMNGNWYKEEIPELVVQAARLIGIKATYS